MKNNDHLTAPNATLAEQVRASVPGMAHFALTGPAGRTCRECEHWGAGGGRDGGYYADGQRLLKPRMCNKYRKLMLLGRKNSPLIRYDTPSCRHFDEAVAIPPIEEPKSQYT